MPKIFLIKNRLHQQQLKLLESQNLIQSKSDDSFNIEYNSRDCEGDNRSEPLSLVAKKQNNDKWNEYKNSSSNNATGKLNNKINNKLLIASLTHLNVFYMKRVEISFFSFPFLLLYSLLVCCIVCCFLRIYFNII